jgi:hypothetical protein
MASLVEFTQDITTSGWIPNQLATLLDVCWEESDHSLRKNLGFPSFRERPWLRLRLWRDRRRVEKRLAFGSTSALPYKEGASSTAFSVVFDSLRGKPTERYQSQRDTEYNIQICGTIRGDSNERH